MQQVCLDKGRYNIGLLTPENRLDNDIAETFATRKCRTDEF
jgi:hypothetical protein